MINITLDRCICVWLDFLWIVIWLCKKIGWPNNVTQWLFFSKSNIQVSCEESNWDAWSTLHCLLCASVYFHNLRSTTESNTKYSSMEKNHKINESFRLCKLLLFLVLEEHDRLIFDIFLLKKNIYVGIAIRKCEGKCYQFGSKIKAKLDLYWRGRSFYQTLVFSSDVPFLIWNIKHLINQIRQRP